VVKNEVGLAILKFLKAAKRPVTTREIARQLGIAWHTADRYCLKLQLKKKVTCFTIGKATAWVVT
jgi:DNA-binding IclR family transcriptional regulator